jgi:twitching motility protein PilT
MNHMSQPIDRLLKLMHDRGASDLHLSVGRCPTLRVAGRLEPVRYRVLTDPEMNRLLQPIAMPSVWEEFQATGDGDFAYQLTGSARFRVNVFRQERGMSAVFRIIPSAVPTVDQLGLPAAVLGLINLRSGLFLVTGPTGSGKSTTLAALVNEINNRRSAHVVTIEDPIEFVHENRRCVFSQREVGPHTKGFADALKAAMREAPEVIVVGEMRDRETVEMALSAASTGVLVLGTLHTNSAAKTVDRIINVFPAGRQAGIRGSLASALRAVVAQQLVPRKGGGRVAAHEVLISTSAISSAIRDGRTHQLGGMLQLGKRLGMVSMDSALKELVKADLVEPMHAFEKALNKDDFRAWMKEHGASGRDELDS